VKKERGALFEYIARSFLETSPSKNRESSPYRVTVHHLPESGVTWTEPGGSPGSTSGVHYVPESTLEETLCDAEILDLGEPGGTHLSGDEDSSPFASIPRPDMAPFPIQIREEDRHGPRLRRTIPLTLRRKVLERDERQCTVPGCGHRSHLALHHIIPIAAGGADRAGGLTTVCFRCHRALHTHMLFVEGNAPGALGWKNRHGVVIKGGAPL